MVKIRYPTKSITIQVHAMSMNVAIVREPPVGLIMWLRPKGLKVYSYVEKYAEFKNQSLKNRLVHKVAMRNGIPLGLQVLK